jgi:hypothetical protein
MRLVPAPKDVCIHGLTVNAVIAVCEEFSSSREILKGVNPKAEMIFPMTTLLFFIFGSFGKSWSTVSVISYSRLILGN